MAHVKRTALVAHSVEKMFSLVADVEAYPTFLPWCGGSRVMDRHSTGMTATIDIDFKGLRQSFTTVNTHLPPEQINLKLKDGPFSSLSGQWRFNALTPEACEVVFDLNYVFAAGMLGTLLNPVFDHIAGTFIDAFVARADQVHGT